MEPKQLQQEARKRVAAVRDDPEGRYLLVEAFYEQHPVPGPDWYGRSELDFMRWEIERGVLNSPQDRAKPGSPWWRAVNETLIRDAIEAGLLTEAGRWEAASPSVARWMDFLSAPSAAAWYRAHNASVLRGYIDAALLARRERPAEQFLMNLVLARVLFAQALAEAAPFAAGDRPLLSRLLSDPRLPAVAIAMQVPDFYPRTYPLSAGEEEILERRAHSADDDALAAIDAEPCSNLDELFAYATKALDAPELSRFIDRGLVCYPHGLLTDPDTAGPRLWLPWLAEQRDLYPSRWTDELLDRMRLLADPEADEVVARYFEDTSDAGAHEFFHQLVRKPDPLPEECSPAVADYLNERPPLPRWADPDLIATGEEFFGEWGLYVPLVLICSSLPECYGAAKGVQVLHLTARLATDARRRVIETAQMVLDVMSPGGMAIDGPGYKTVRRVRLMHAGVRHLILNDPRVTRGSDGPGPRWDPDWGVPINQEDLAGTLTTFSWSVITGLRSLGVPIDQRQEEAYLHAWNVVGAMLGIREEMIPKDCADADALATAIRARHWKASPEGTQMTAALLDMLEGSGPARVVPGFGPAMIRHFVGDELADTLEVPRASRTGAIARRLSVAAVAAGLAQQHSRAVRAVAGRVSRSLLRAYADFDRGGERPSFAIPTTLASSWKTRSARR